MIDQALQFIAAALPLALVGLGLAFAAVAYDQSSKGKTPLLQTGLATLAFALSLFSCGAFVPQAQAAPADHQATAEASAHQAVRDSDLQGKGALGNLEASSDGVQFFLGNDLLWAGSACSFDKVQAPNDLLAAGQSIEVDNATVKGSVRAAGQNVVVKGTQVKQSVTLAGQLVQVAKGSSEAVALCGQTAAFSGETKALHAAAGTVIINGIFAAGGDTLFACLLDTGTVWLVGVPLAFLGVFLGAPLWCVCLLIFCDDIAKVTIGFVHLFREKWVRNVTAQIQQN